MQLFQRYHCAHLVSTTALMLLLGVMIMWPTTAMGERTTITIEGGSGNTVIVTTPTPKPAFQGVKSSVDVAILLDTSNSMDGLIDQAKRQLWAIVNQFAHAQKAGQTPLLRVAVFEYGNSGLPASEGYIRQVVPLTDDLDKVSQGLFTLTTNGGDEYCGQVIAESLKRLDWSKEPGAYKVIFIAGNEPFTQGPVDYKSACAAAIQAGVVVNTIHCGNRNAGQQGQWQHGAQLAEGDFFNINQDQKVVHISAPQDKVLIKLNTKLNETYIWYGTKKQQKYYAQNQAAQDSNAANLSPSVMSQRAASKSSGVYRNQGRDLVDTVAEDADALKKIDATALPEELQKLTEAQRVERIERLQKQRAAIQAQIKQVAKEREAYVAKVMKERAAEGNKDATLGDAVLEAIREQLTEAGYEITETK